MNRTAGAFVVALLPALLRGEGAAAVVVRVDPRIETLAIVQLLAGYEKAGLITRLDLAYKARVTERFGSFSEHKAVSLFRTLWPRGFAYDAPVAALLHFSDPPAFEPRATVPPGLLARAGSQESLDSFVEALRDFARSADVPAFLASEKAFFESIEGDVRKTLAQVDVGVLEAYYGQKQGGYALILAPLLHPGGFGPRIERNDGTFDVYGVIGPQTSKEGRPVFGTLEDFRYLVWHEFSHSFLNPLVDRFASRVDGTAALFEPLKKVMAEQAYGTWRICVYEHLVRAATTRFAFRELGDEAGKTALRVERAHGFAHVDALARRLESYEQDRAKYPDIAAFFPRLLDVFEETQKGTPPETRAPGPRVVKSTPVPGDLNVDPAQSEIRVEFDQDMGPGYAWIQKDPALYPKVTGGPVWTSPRVCVIHVALEPGRDYWVGVNAFGIDGFANRKGNQAEGFEIPFRTGTRR